jgi:GNAT superfamily N-acetyltransferase
MQRAYNLDFNPNEMLENAMKDGSEFTPPDGRMLLVFVDGGDPAGVGCLRRSEVGIGEIKRMYIRPAFRGKGIGAALVAKLCEEARGIGYTRLRLDSAPFMETAHALYRAVGFREVPSYLKSEVAARLGPNWVYMELRL